MLSSTPVDTIVISRAEPPNERKGSGSPLVGSRPVTTPRLTSVWVAMSSVMPSARDAPNGSWARPAAQPPPDEHGEEPDEHDGAHEAQLLADDGEDEVGVRLGQIEELLARAAHVLDW